MSPLLRPGHSKGWLHRQALVFWWILLAVSPIVSAWDPTSRYLRSRSPINHPRSPADPVPAANQPALTPCGEVAEDVLSQPGPTAHVDAVKGLRCLESIPVNKDDALHTIQTIRSFLDFHTGTLYLRDNKFNADGPPVDLYRGLQSIENKVNGQHFLNQFDFETNIAVLFMFARDIHLRFEGMVFSGVFQWKRPSNFRLVSISVDEKNPEVYLYDQVKRGIKTPVELINNEKVLDYLQISGEDTYYRDPNARFNSQMAWKTVGATYAGSFLSPVLFPDPYTNLSFADGKWQAYNNYAETDQNLWYDVHDAESAYTNFVLKPLVRPQKRPRKRSQEDIDIDDHWAPKSADTSAGMDNIIYENISGDNDGQVASNLGETCESPVDGFIPYPASDRVKRSASSKRDNYHEFKLCGEIWAYTGPSTGSGDPVAILSIRTFAIDSAARWRDTIRAFLRSARDKRIKELIIDMRGNSGGMSFLPATLVRQLFPHLSPFDGRRIRTGPISLEATKAYTMSEGKHNVLLPYDLSTKLDADGNLFPEDFTKIPFKGDANYPSDIVGPLFMNKQSPRSTGANAVTTFQPANIAIISDSLCSGACALFMTLMRTTVPGVKFITLGGLPLPEIPDSLPAGGSAGCMAMTTTELLGFLMRAPQLLSQPALDLIRHPAPITFFRSTVNFVDCLRSKTATIPEQFVLESADCHLYYTEHNFNDVGALYQDVYDVAFGSRKEEAGFGAAAVAKCRKRRKVNTGWHDPWAQKDLGTIFEGDAEGQ